MKYATCFAILTGIFAANVARAQHVISSTTSLFAPSFRGNASTTYFGWTEGNWDANPGDETLAGELINNPAPNINPGALANVGLVQTTNVDILSSSNNIFTNNTANAGLTLTIPTAGSAGSGFTTIVIQGKGLASGQGLLNHVLWGDINGVSASFVVGGNATSPSTTQWWAKYEIPGNLATYNVNITGAPGASNTFPISIAELRIDTAWSPSGYAPDTATVPEPASIGLIALGGMTWLRRRSSGRGSASFGGMRNAI